MTQFWIAALALGLVAAAMVLVPVIRAWARADGERNSSVLGVGIVVALAIPVAGIMLYSHWTTWDWGTGGTQAQAGSDEGMHEMDEALRALEQRLVQNPEELESWLLLGRTYMSLRRFEDAAGAFRKAAALDGGDSPQIQSDLGEALALSQPEGLQGEAGAIFERVLVAEPAYPKALWYGGLNAFENANWDLAVERLEKLLSMNPPETLVPLIEERIAMARANSGDGPMAGMSMPGTDGTNSAAAPAPAPAATEAPAPVPAAGEGIRLDVSLDPALAARIPRPAPVFIIARLPTGGPPLAVVRARSNELPLSVTLTDANAMMEGVTILDQPELQLVARISLSGGPGQSPGDLYATVDYRGEEGGPVRLHIDRVAE
ncbi:tetratricopeptide repeat protein [Thioalkalivibrio sp. XN279]|uniref:tetratricopeptide repeat protein n=1 Tax=Thioalkalivibrio sp. XN279 TaxID=2714953 RepID=UPI00140E08DD|nr:tetratricopeptide repeat protein [Thioalkalivibrio sp. XN279]NHA14431.1 tetratricopeptide repeat protein [Thioalkalivibrio sp. XN279]